MGTSPSAPLRERPRPQPLWVRVEIDQLAAQAIVAADPSLRDIPIGVVRQSEESHKAALFSVSPAARQRGARAGMPVFVARRKAGQGLRVLPRNDDAEQRVQQALAGIYAAWTPELSTGSTWALLDLAGTPAARAVPYDEIGQRLVERLKSRAGLTEIAAGVSTSRVVAQILARQAVPDGVVTCAPGDEARMLAEVDADALPGLASACRERVHLYGLDRVDQLLALDRATLVRRFGKEEGARLYGLVRGLAPEGRRRGADTVEAETVLSTDVNDDGLLLDAVRLTASKATHEMRRLGQVAGSLRLTLTYSDNRRAQKTVRLPASTDDFGRIERAVLGAFAESHVRRVALKSIHVAALRTSPATGQRDLFDGVTQAKARRLGAALTDIRQRLGFDAVVPGGALRLRDDPAVLE
jgi:nucleotidyltransferase/DNA polymerase involved in DNA repair